MSTSVTANTNTNTTNTDVGTDFVCGGVKYVIPPIKFGKIKKVWPILMALNEFELSILKRAGGPPSSSSPEFAALHGQRIQFILDIFEIACKDKYPELTAQFMDDNLSFNEMVSVPVTLNRFLAASGFEPGEAMPPVPGTEVPVADSRTSMH